MPRASSRQPMEAAARPLPSEDTTPPVTKMYFADISASANLVVLIGHAYGARLSIAGMGGGGNGLPAGTSNSDGRPAAVGQPGSREAAAGGQRLGLLLLLAQQFRTRSEERRVGKEGRS